ncbi:MAG: YCF48-related protein [Phycisphaerales bacterium]|nr:YCF48-related protein [Phycisphaerales bacterium]
MNISNPIAIDMNITEMIFTSNTVGFATIAKATSNNLIIKTKDGGINWYFVPVNNPNTNYTINGIAFSNGIDGIAVSEESYIYRTKDSGNTWNLVATKLPLFACQYATPAVVCAVGEEGIIYRSTDSGRTWLSVRSPTTYDLESIIFLTPNEGFAVGGDETVQDGAGVIIHTIDSGKTWVQIPNLNTLVLQQIAYYPTNKKNLIAVGDYNTIIRSTDGGITWTTVYGPKGESFLYGISFANEQTAVAAGSRNPIFITTDGGQIGIL